MTSEVNTDDSRVNVLIRLLGILFFVFGLAMTILTGQAAASASIQPEVVPVYLLCSAMLMVAGFVALISKYRPSTPTKSQ